MLKFAAVPPHFIALCTLITSRPLQWVFPSCLKIGARAEGEGEVAGVELPQAARALEAAKPLAPAAMAEELGV